MPENIRDLIGRKGIVAVLEIENEKDALPVAEALLKGGVSVIELALRTPAAEPSIALIAEKVKDMVVGVGTIIESGQASRVKKQRNVCFGVSPGLNPEIVREAIDAGLPFVPGIATPSELEQAISLGSRVVKFFPAEPMGGINYLKSMSAPYRHLNIKYIPLGGVSLSNLAEYAALDDILCIGGSWLAGKDLIRSGNWAEISRRSREAMDIWESVRGRKE